MTDMPLRRLLLAVISRAFEDINYAKFSTDKSNRQCNQSIAKEALRWIMNEEDHSLHSFNTMCDYVGLEAEWMRSQTRSRFLSQNSKVRSATLSGATRRGTSRKPLQLK
jgi:hypothetical protein